MAQAKWVWFDGNQYGYKETLTDVSSPFSGAVMNKEEFAAIVLFTLPDTSVIYSNLAVREIYLWEPWAIIAGGFFWRG